jgi:hypothetical protein
VTPSNATRIKAERGKRPFHLHRSLDQVEKMLRYKLVDVMVTAVVYAVNAA